MPYPIFDDGFSIRARCPEGTKPAVEEANAADDEPRFRLTSHDHQGSNDDAPIVARQVVTITAAEVIGPPCSTAQGQRRRRGRSRGVRRGNY